MVQVNARFFPVGLLSQGRATKKSITNTTDALYYKGTD
jgi:hypothetical protein